MQAVPRRAQSVTGADSKIDTFIQITRVLDVGGLGSPPRLKKEPVDAGVQPRDDKA